MDFTKLLRAFLSNVYKMTDPELDALFNASDANEDQTLAALLEKDKARVQPFINKFQEGKNAGKAEALTALEGEIKKAYGSQSELKGLELISEIISSQAAAGKGQSDQQLSEDDIKKLPAFQPIQREFNRQLKQAKDDGEKAVTELKTGYEKEQAFGEVAKKAVEVRNGLNPVISQNPKIAANTESSFLSALKSFDWQKQGDVWVPVKDGKVQTDAHGNALTLEELAKATAGEWYEFSQNNGGSNAGNGGADDPSKGGGSGTKSGEYPKNVTKPKTFAELSAIVNNKTIDAKDRETVLQVWESEQAGGTQ